MFKTANNDSISRPNSRPKLPFPGNGKGKFRMPREGKGREIWGMYSRESRETGIPAHPCEIDACKEITLGVPKKILFIGFTPENMKQKKGIKENKT